MSPSSICLADVVVTVTPARAANDDMVLALARVVRSAEPAVVFSSLARLCVPLFSDACTIDIIEHGRIGYRIACGPDDLYPVTGSHQTDHAIRTPFTSVAAGPGQGRYVGVITHRWATYRPGARDVGRAALLARHCVAIIGGERRVATTGAATGAKHGLRLITHGPPAATTPGA